MAPRPVGRQGLDAVGQLLPAGDGRLPPWEATLACLNHVRLARGAHRLRETSHTIAGIASEVGFADQSYFATRFKRAFGRTPKEPGLGCGASRSSKSSIAASLSGPGWIPMLPR